MKSKKILIAALSLGLIFAPTKPLVFAADAELAEVDFANKRLNLIHKQEIVTGKTENEYNKIKAIRDEALKILNSEKNKKTELEKNIERLKNELEANPSNDRKIEIVTEINNLKSRSDLQNQKIDELDQDYKEKEEKRAHYDSIASPERYLLSDYRSANRDIDIEIADAKYQIRVFRNQGLLEDQERNSFISEINAVSKTENPEDYIKIYESARAKAEQKKAEKLAENPEIEPDNQTPNQNQTTAPNEEELKAAKESAIENLKSKTNLKEAQVKLFEEEISNAENLEELAEINKKVNEADEKAAKAKELAEAKEKAKQSLENAKNINLEQKTNFEKQIEDSNTIDQLLEIENNIKLADEKAQQEKIAQELANSKQILEEKLENTNLSSKQKDAFKDRILNAKNQADLEAIQIDIDQADEKVKKEKELEENKKLLIENLNSKENLRPDQKEEFEKQIAEANDKEALAKIEEKINVAVEVANKEKTAEKLKAAKESSIENLKSKSNLTEDQEKLFEEAISNAENLEELDEINKKVNEADEKAKQEKVSQELENAKQLLEEKLENTGLSPEQKDTFKNRILKAERQAELETIESDINQADEKAIQEKVAQKLENAKSDLAEKLFSTSLNQDQKDSFLEKINKAADLEGLEAIDKEIEIASNQVDENIENETEKDPSNEETPSTPDPEEEKPKDEEKDPSEENPNEEEAGNLPENQDDNTTEKPDPSNEDSVDDDNELENNPQNPDPDNGNTDSSDTSENVENTPTDDNSANGRENNTADGENPEKTSPEGQRPRNTKITRPISDDINPVSRPLENPSYLPSTITINETSTAKKDTIELKDDLKYLKKGTYKISDLEAKRDKIEEAIKKNKATVRAIGILEDLAPKTLAKNRAKINALLEQSQRLLAQANYALAEYNYLLSK